MAFYDAFLSKINCEEFYSSAVDDTEYDEVMCLMAQESDGLRNFSEWLDSLETTERKAALEQQALEQAIEQSSTLQTPQGAKILIKRECAHGECSAQSRCKREVRYGGIAI